MKGRMPQGMDFMGDNVVSASGLTSVAMQEENLKLDFLETELYVEESYLSTGDEVEAGASVFRISGDTLTEAKNELQNAVTEAELAYRQGILDHKKKMLEAKTTFETASVNEKYAKTVYDNSLKEASAQLTKLKEQVETARELASEYEKSVNEDYYRSYYKVDELYQVYSEHCALLLSFYEKWDIERLEDLYGNSVQKLSVGVDSSKSGNNIGGSSGGGSAGGGKDLPQFTGKMSVENSGPADAAAVNAFFVAPDAVEAEEKTDLSVYDDEKPKDIPDGIPGGGKPENGNKDKNETAPGGTGQTDGNPPQMGGSGGNAGYNEEQQKLSVYNLLDDLVKQESQDYKTALASYEDAKSRAAAGLVKAQSDLAELEAELTQAQSNYEKQAISVKADYETTLAESQNAGIVYETTVQGLEETLSRLENDRDDAKENLEAFEKNLGDGTFYTKKAGTIVVNTVRANSRITGDIMVIAYSDPETVTISANVDQSSIASVSIGESVYAVINEYGNYHGTVKSINPVTRAQSRSSVTYQVTVALDGEVGNLESNLTAYVYFGVTEEMMRQMEKREGPVPGADKDQTGNGTERDFPKRPGTGKDQPENGNENNFPKRPEPGEGNGKPEIPTSQKGKKYERPVEE